MSKKFSKFVYKRIIKAKEIKGINKFLSFYFKKKFFVNSATPEYELKKIIKHRKEDIFFHNIYGSPKSKLENLKNILKKYNIRKKYFVFFEMQNKI